MNNKEIYCFISDESKMFYRASQFANGNYSITSSAQPYPITHNPTNLLKTIFEFATNLQYNSLNRSISYKLDFVKDGAAILRNFYFNGNGIEQKCYFTVIQFNGKTGLYELAYNGKFDLSQKSEDPKSGTFSVSCVDDTAWGVLSKNDSTEFSIDCSNKNPNAVKVLFDGITLINKATFQTVQSGVTQSSNTFNYPLPFVLINQDGDSAGVVYKNQTSVGFQYLDDTDSGGNPLANNLQDSGYWFFQTNYAIQNVHISGIFKFVMSSNTNQSYGLKVSFYTSKRQKILIVDRDQAVSAPGHPANLPVVGQEYTVNFDFFINLDVSESIFFVAEFFSNFADLWTITPIVTNIVIETKTKAQPWIAYGLRPLDFLKELVSAATFGRYTISSDEFTINNKSILLSGDAIRNIPNARAYSSFKDFFTTFNALRFMALRNNDGTLSMEKFMDVYNTDSTIIDLGDIIDITLEPATEYYANEVLVGSPNQDLRHPSGRLEFNSTNTFSLRVLNSDKKLELVTKYRTGCYEIQFLIMDYQGSSTQDNSGDKSIYLAEITDELGTSEFDVETFENITVDDAPLEPFIKSPLNNDTLTYNKPLLKGIAPAGSTVNIYIDNVLDGSCVADSIGNWTYQVVTALTPFEQGVHTGVHVIDTTFGDESDPKSTISVLVDTSYETEDKIIYPADGDYLYNNLPVVRGVSQAGKVLQVVLNGVNIGTVTVDNTGTWSVSLEFFNFNKYLLPNGANSISVGTDTNNFTVNTNVDFPLITYVGSELDGFAIINNLPLIKGIAKPNTPVTVWLNYITYIPLGTVMSDANGNWKLQVVPVSYQDPLTHVGQILAPVKNGLNIFSTSLINHVVPIFISGYKLDRPAFSEIDGVPDNTVFNTAYSPKRMLMNNAPRVKAILNQMPKEQVYFETSAKNGDFATVLDGVRTSENADVPASSLGNPFALLEYAVIKTKAYKTFAKTLYDFNNGGIVKANFRGTDIFMLPIGSMKVNSLVSDVQEWKLLISPETTYMSLLNLYKEGLIINIMKNSLYHSDYNLLHFVTYNFQDNPKYNFKERYDDWFSNRNSAWALNPDYIQKVQKSDPFRDQIITNGLSNIKLDVYRCSDAIKVRSINYVAVTPAPLNSPNIVYEALIDPSTWDEDEYFCVLNINGVNSAISERIAVATKWSNTILIESYSSVDKATALFSTGFRTILRVEGLVKKAQPNVFGLNVSQQDDGDTDMLWSDLAYERTIRFGTAYGLPDYLYLKVASALLLDQMQVEGVFYTLQKDEKIKPSDDVDGHPLYYYNVNVDFAVNQSGISVPAIGDGTGSNTGVVLVADATAFGLPAGSLINISLDNE